MSSTKAYGVYHERRQTFHDWTVLSNVMTRHAGNKKKLNTCIHQWAFFMQRFNHREIKSCATSDQPQQYINLKTLSCPSMFTNDCFGSKEFCEKIKALSISAPNHTYSSVQMFNLILNHLKLRESCLSLHGFWDLESLNCTSIE
jgi:hypothetical protein